MSLPVDAEGALRRRLQPGAVAGGRCGTRTTGSSTRPGSTPSPSGVFAWALTQPAEDTYDFSTLDRIVERRRGRGPRRSAWPPAPAPTRRGWRAAYPEVTRTDFEGRRHRFGQRHNSCPSSPVFRRLSAELARRVARRYADNPAVRRLARRQRVRRRLLLRPVRGRASGTGCARGTAPWTRSTTPGTRRSGRTRFTDWDEIEPPSRADRALARPRPHRVPGHHAGLPAVHVRRDARQLPRREGGHPRVQPGRAGHHQLHGHVPADRLPPLGAASGLRVLGQLPARTTRRRRGWRWPTT